MKRKKAQISKIPTNIKHARFREMRWSIQKVEKEAGPSFVMAQRVKNRPVMQETQETWAQTLESGRSLGGGNGNLVCLPEKSHGQRSLAGYGPWGHKESGTS